MRRIAKHKPPAGAIRGGNWNQASIALRLELKPPLAPARRTQRARAVYEDQVIRSQARRALADEQAELCAFCETRLLPDAELDEQGQPHPASIRIAHWRPVEAAPEAAVNWGNLFASCARQESCDTNQGAAEPGIETAAQRDWSTQLKFTSDGGVSVRTGAPPELAEAISERVWNLNCEVLCRARRTAIEAELQHAKARRDARRCPKAIVIDERVARLVEKPDPFNSAVLEALRRWRA